MNIEVAVISAPRPLPLLDRTLKSLQQAGFSVPRVYFDAAGRGCFGNWRRAFYAELVAMGRHSDWLLICEDDIELSDGLAEWLACSDVPRDGVLSLYAAPMNSHEQQGWHRVTKLPKNAQGALAYLFPPAVAQELYHSRLPSWPNHTDRAIGRWCKETRTPYYVHCPSFVQHLAPELDNSALADPGGVVSLRRASHFVASVADLL